MEPLSLRADVEQALESGARLGAVVLEAGVERLALDAVGRYPLASVRKVVTLGGYAVAVASGMCDPAEPVALRDIDRWSWPGTDGGAHERVIDWWVGRGILHPGPEPTVPLRELALAMIRFSDNAAADYLLHRVGEECVGAFGAQMGLRTQDPILPTLGEFRAWHRAPEQWLTMSAANRARVARQMAASEESPLDAVPVDDATQHRCAAAGCQGTAREWAGLMARLAAGTGLPNAAGRMVWEALERPSTQGDDGRFGAKAGDLPGILTFAGYVRARSGGAPDIAVAMFLSGLDLERLHRLSAALPQTPSQSLELPGLLAAVR
jgi:beta-lactamase class A